MKLHSTTFAQTTIEERINLKTKTS